MANKRLHIIDGSGYIFRAYYAIRPLSTADGEPTNAVLGFTTMIEKAVREEEPEYLAIAFDAKGPTFRKEIYEDYKATRPPPPDDLRTQIPRIHEIVDAFKIKKFVIPGVEADDVIATLVKMARAEGMDVQIITGDKDLMQLVGDDVTMYEPMRGQRYKAKQVEEKMGVPPHQIADALALAGDSSDNIPGVRSVGMKTAAKLLREHGNLENVLTAAVAGGVKGKMGEKLAASVEDARLSKKLVLLNESVELDIGSLADLRYDGGDKPALLTLYRALEFKRLIPKLEAEAGEDAPAPEVAAPARSLGLKLDPTKYRTLTAQDELISLQKRLEGVDRFAIALELDTLHYPDATLLGMSFATGLGEVDYIPIGQRLDTASLPLSDVVGVLRPVLENSEIKKVSLDGKSVHGFFAQRGITVGGMTFDATLASYLLDPDELNYNHEIISRRFVGHEAIERSRVLGKTPFVDAAIEVATKLVGERADIALASFEPLATALEEAGVKHIFEDVEVPLMPVLARTESNGIKIDVAMLEEMKGRFGKELQRLEKACYAAAGGQEFNLGSPKQLQKVLFEDLGLKIIKRTKTGYSTDHSVLEALSTDHELPGLLLEHRQVQKLQSTYVESLPKMVSKSTGRVHTIFNQVTAATGRLSSNDPNLQNIPIRSELGRSLRKVFIAEEGNQLISVDYSQVELRVLAHFSQDEVLMNAFHQDADVHTRTASVLFEIPPEEVTREQRTQAKAVNFGVLYGMGPMRLARDLKITRRAASEFVKNYFERQPGVRAFVDQTLESARETGVVRTLLGRRRLVNEINSANRGARAAAERIATNTPIQGSAADLIKLAMIRVDAVLRERYPESKLLLQVHDELLVEAPTAQAEEVSAMVKREMEGVFPLDVPLRCQAAVGANWDDAH